MHSATSKAVGSSAGSAAAPTPHLPHKLPHGCAHAPSRKRRLNQSLHTVSAARRSKTSTEQPHVAVQETNTFPHHVDRLRRQLERLYQLDYPTAWLYSDTSSLVNSLQGRYSALPVSVLPAQLTERKNESPPSSKLSDPKNKQKKDDFYANVGDAIRTLREETPTLFQKDLTYDLYRDDIVFKDPRNAFHGKKNYKTLFWSLRFHGRLFFRVLYVDVHRIWQPEESIIRMRWTVHGVPRVPWEAEGVFDGVSQWKLDRDGKIYEHSVDNVILRDPPLSRNPLMAGLNLLRIPQLAGAPQAPCPGAYFTAEAGSHDEPQLANPCEMPQQLPSQQQQQQSMPKKQGRLPRMPDCLRHASWMKLYRVLLGTAQLLQKQTPPKIQLDS